MVAAEFLIVSIYQITDLLLRIEYVDHQCLLQKGFGVFPGSDQYNSLSGKSYRILIPVGAGTTDVGIKESEPCGIVIRLIFRHAAELHALIHILHRLMIIFKAVLAHEENGAFVLIGRIMQNLLYTESGIDLCLIGVKRSPRAFGGISGKNDHIPGILTQQISPQSTRADIIFLKNKPALSL